MHSYRPACSKYSIINVYVPIWPDSQTTWLMCCITKIIKEGEKMREREYKNMNSLLYRNILVNTPLSSTRFVGCTAGPDSLLHQPWVGSMRGVGGGGVRWVSGSFNRSRMRWISVMAQYVTYKVLRVNQKWRNSLTLITSIRYKQTMPCRPYTKHKKMRYLM